MLSHHTTKEAQEKKVIIPDVSIDAMKDFLQFIYTGEKPQNDNLSLELLTLADKVSKVFNYCNNYCNRFFQYEVDDLKSRCAEQLSSALTIDNVVNAYLVADLHNASNLKDNCLAFMASNFSHVLQSQGWLHMCKSGGEKVADVCNAISNILLPKKASSKVDSKESAPE